MGSVNISETNVLLISQVQEVIGYCLGSTDIGSLSIPTPILEVKVYAARSQELTSLTDKALTYIIPISMAIIRATQT